MQTSDQNPARDRFWIAALAAVKLLLHLATNGRYGYFRDELYYLACGERLAFGYVDHPPLIAFVTKLARVTLGESIRSLRFVPALAGATVVALTSMLARELGGRRFAQMLAGLAVLIAPYFLVTGTILTMNGLEPVFWASCALLLVRAIRRESSKELFWLGPIVGLGLLNKHSMTWPVAALFLGLAVGKSRRILASKQVVLAALIASAIVAGHVVWQVQHHFPTREFMKNALSGKNEPYTLLGFFGEQLKLAHPLTAPIWIAGLLTSFTGRKARLTRPLGVAFCAIFVLIVATGAKAYYLGPAYPWLFAIGAVSLERWTKRAVRIALVSLMLVTGLALAPMAIPMLPIETYQRYAAAFGEVGKVKSGEKLRLGALPQTYADMFGWDTMTARVADVFATLDAPEKLSSAILTGNYGEASAIEFFGRRYGLPRVISGDNGWYLWGPGSPNPQVVIAVGLSRRDLGLAFEDVRQVAIIEHPLARPDETGLPVYVCRNPRAPLDAIWPQFKHYR
jgi:hypothetical protein